MGLEQGDPSCPRALVVPRALQRPEVSNFSPNAARGIPGDEGGNERHEFGSREDEVGTGEKPHGRGGSAGGWHGVLRQPQELLRS